MFDKVNEGVFSLFSAGGMYLAPFEYTGYRDEILASKSSAWLGTPLNESPVYDVEGPDAAEFLTSICINNFTGMKVGTIRHAVLCNKKGQILTDGVVMKIAADHFRTYWLMPVIDFYVSRSALNIRGVDLSGREFFIQIAGPKSLEILELASGSDLHDIQFARHRTAKIAGIEVRILRLGMTGTLAYELHGDMHNLDPVFDHIWQQAKPFGARKIGRKAYVMNHTEAGFANIFIHYPMPWFDEPDLAAYCENNPVAKFFNYHRDLVGSVGAELDVRYKTPYDVGWDFLVKFDHQFPGRSALEQIAKNPPNQMVTLEWNADDVGDIVASQFKGPSVTPFDPIDDRSSDTYFIETKGFHYHADKVMNGERMVGTSTGRINSVYYRRMLSLGFIQKELAVVGNKLTLIWGSPNRPQKNIQVTVARVPYIDLPNNKHLDVESIPRSASLK